MTGFLESLIPRDGMIALLFLKSEFNLDCPYKRKDGLISSDEYGCESEHYKI